MNLTRFFDVLKQYQAVFIFALWGAMALWIMSRLPYGFDEVTAKSLVIVWAVIEGMTSMDTDFLWGGAVLNFAPDFRALWFFPVAIYWPENLLAVKLFSVAVTAIAAFLLHRWAQEHLDSETALMGSGLLLISPLTLGVIDSLAAAPFLLLAFTLTGVLDRKYRDKPNAFGLNYFIQMLLVASSVSMHPAGLALAAALAWQWKAAPLEGNQSKYFWAGLAITSVFILALRQGWPGMAWLANPVNALAGLWTIALDGQPPDLPGQLIGTALLVCVVLLLIFDRRMFWDSLLGRSLWWAVLLGLPAADQTWAFMASCVLFYSGMPRLIKLNQMLPGQNFFSQRGIVGVVLFAICLNFMLLAKHRYIEHQRKVMGPVDQLIYVLAEQAEADKKAAASDEPDLHIASQWPGRTLLACKCPVTALPPPTVTPQALVENLGPITHLLFDHTDTGNAALMSNIAALNNVFKTVDRSADAVVVFNAKAHTPARPTPSNGNEQSPQPAAPVEPEPIEKTGNATDASQ